MAPTKRTVWASRLKSFHAGDFLRATCVPRNLWISRSDVLGAALRRGIYYGEPCATLNDGRSLRLLWQPSRAVHQLLGAVLKEWLGERVEARDRLSSS